MRLEQLEAFAEIYLKYDSLVYLLPNVVPGSPGTAQKVRTKLEVGREKRQRRAMCAALGMGDHTPRHRAQRLHRQIRQFQASLYDELCQRVRLRVMRGGAAADALRDAPLNVRRAALSLHLLSAALKNETKRLTEEGAASVIVSTLCSAWEGARRCGGCGGRGAGGAGGCAECRGEGAPPPAVLRAVGQQFEVEDLDALRKLWLQYREVALQKLRALTTAGDDLRHVPVAARPTATDWRVIDLTLLYDHNFKLLTDTSVKHHEQLQPLIALFSLVQQFGLERGEELAWRDAHRHASHRGSCVSLVLLQRRWHELCGAARAAVLATMHVAGAPALPPLHAALVRRFPEVATRPLMSWRELVAAGRVYTNFQKSTDESSEWLAPEPKAPAPADTDKEDDLIIVEKDIETIELRESDGESDDLIIDEDDKSLVALAQDTQNLQQTIREEIQNHRELLRNTIGNTIGPNPVEQSNVTVSAMDIDNANVRAASVSNTQKCTNFLVCNENIVYLYVDNNQALNNDNTVLGNVASGGVSSNKVPSTSSLNSLDTGQSLSILSKIDPESSEAMIIFEDDDSDEMSPSGDNNSGDERSDNDRCNNAEGDSKQIDNISVRNEDNTKKEAVTESQDTKDIRKQIVQTDNINHSFKENHNLSTDEIKSKDDNTNKEVPTPKQNTENAGNPIVESNDLGKPSSDINRVYQSNDAKHDFHTEDIPTESKNQVEDANKETTAKSHDTECTRNQISESNEVIQPTNDKKGVDGSIVNNDLRNDDSETQKEVSVNTPEEIKNTETATKSQETENSTNQIVESNDKESNQNFEDIDKNEMECKKELTIEIDEPRNSEASSVGDQLAIDIRENLGNDMYTASESIPKIDNVFSIAIVQTKLENEVSNDATSHSNETVNEMMVDKNVLEMSANNETDDVANNSDETDNASNLDTTDVMPGAIHSKDTEKMDTNVLETSTNNETDGVASNSDETHNASNIDTTDVMPGAIHSNDSEKMDTNVLETSTNNETDAVASNSDATDNTSNMDTTDVMPRAIHSNDTEKMDTNVLETSTNNETDAVASNSDATDNTSNMDTTDVMPRAIHSNDTEKMDTNVLETSTNNETDAVESNSEETDNDITEVTPAEIDPKLLMTARIPLTRVDSPRRPPPPSLLVEDFSCHPDHNARRLGLSDACLLRNRHLLRMCRPVSVHIGRLSSALLDRYLRGGRPARRVLLPDIEEVRRANRRLATAQVAPTPLPSAQDSEDSGDATEQPPPLVNEVTEEMPLPTEEELMNLLQRCEPPASGARAGPGSGRKYCCAARRHRAVNDARARLAARAGKRPPDQQDIHGQTHRSPGSPYGFTQCKCCCLHLLPGAAHAALLARLARRRRRLERQAHTLLHRKTEADEDDNSDSDDDDGEDLDIAVTNQATKKRWKKKDKQPSVENEKVPNNTEQPSSNDDYLEWIRQKTLANKYFHIQAIGEETHKNKQTHTDTEHKRTETTTVQKQPVSIKAQTQTHNKYVPRVFGNIQSKDDSSAVTGAKAVESSCKIVSYSGKSTGKTVVKMCRATNDVASAGNRKRKSLEDVADIPNKFTIRVSRESENISIDDDSKIVSQIMKDEAEKQNAQSTSQTVDASGSREDSFKTLESASNKKASELLQVSDDSDDDFVDRLFIDETAQKLDRTVSQNLYFDKVKDGNEIKDKSTVKQAYTAVGKGAESVIEDTGTNIISGDVPHTNDTLNEASQTKTKPNEDAATGTLSDKSDETMELKLLPSKKVYQKVVRPKLASPNTSETNQSAVVTATCDKKDDAKNSVELTTENVNKHLSNESLKVFLTNVKETASDVSKTRAGDDSDDDVQFVEATPVQAKIDPRSLLKTQVRVTPPTRPPTILEQIALMHEKGQKFIIQKVVDQETSPVYKSEPKVNRISRYIGLVPEKPKIGSSQVQVVSGATQPAAGPVVNLNDQLAAMCSPASTQPVVTTTTTTTARPVITIKQLAPPASIPIAPKSASVTNPSKNIYPMFVPKVNKSKYPNKIGQYDKAVITMETTKVPVGTTYIKAANYNQPKRTGNTMIVSKVTADANKPSKVAQYHKAVITMETTKLPASAAKLKATTNFNQPMKIGNTTIIRNPKVNESNSAIKVTPPKPEIKESIPVLTLDGTKDSADSNVNKVNTNQVLSSNLEPQNSVPVLTLDATAVPADDSSINASGLVLKVSQDGLVMTTRDDMATITAVARNDDADDVGSIDNDDGDGAKVDGDGALPIISNVKSLAEPVETIFTKSLNTRSAANSSGAAAELAPAVSAREFVRGRDPTDITVLCVDAARPLLHLRGHHMLVTELEIPTQHAQYWPPTGDRPLAFDTPTESGAAAAPAPAPTGGGGLKVRSFARLPPPAAAPDRVRSEGKVYKKLCDDPLVYAKVLFACPTVQWCRRALASRAWAGLLAPGGAAHAVLRAPPAATSAGLKCDQALPALIDLVTRLNHLKKKQAAAVTYHTQKKPRAPAASDVITSDVITSDVITSDVITSDVITVDSDDEAQDNKMVASDVIDE